MKTKKLTCPKCNCNDLQRRTLIQFKQEFQRYDCNRCAYTWRVSETLPHADSGQSPSSLKPTLLKSSGLPTNNQEKILLSKPFLEPASNLTITHCFSEQQKIEIRKRLVAGGASDQDAIELAIKDAELLVGIVVAELNHPPKGGAEVIATIKKLYQAIIDVQESLGQFDLSEHLSVMGALKMKIAAIHDIPEGTPIPPEARIRLMLYSQRLRQLREQLLEDAQAIEPYLTTAQAQLKAECSRPSHKNMGILAYRLRRIWFTTTGNKTRRIFADSQKHFTKSQSKQVDSYRRLTRLGRFIEVAVAGSNISMATLDEHLRGRRRPGKSSRKTL